MKETLVTCPTCNTPGFTERGLKAHRCKGTKRIWDNVPESERTGDWAVRKTIQETRKRISAAPVGASSDQPSKALVPVATGPVSNDSLMGQQLDEHFAHALGATRKIIVFGAMMLKAQALTVSTRGHGGRFGDKGEGFKGWLEQHAPCVAKSRGTAYRFMALAEGVQEEFRLGKKVDLTLLLTAPDEDLSPALRKKQRSILDFLEGKSPRQLLLQLGGDEGKKKVHKTKDEDLTPEERFNLVHDRIKADANRLMDDTEVFAAKKYFQLWNDAELDHAATIIQSALDAVNAWRKLPKGKRSATAIEDEIRQWKGASK